MGIDWEAKAGLDAHITQVNKPIQLFPIETLNDVEVNIDGVKIVVKFEVIEILEDAYPYLEMFGIDWAFENNFILNLNE